MPFVPDKPSGFVPDKPGNAFQTANVQESKGKEQAKYGMTPGEKDFKSKIDKQLSPDGVEELAGGILLPSAGGKIAGLIGKGVSRGVEAMGAAAGPILSKIPGAKMGMGVANLLRHFAENGAPEAEQAVTKAAAPAAEAAAPEASNLASSLKSADKPSFDPFTKTKLAPAMESPPTSTAKIDPFSKLVQKRADVPKWPRGSDE